MELIGRRIIKVEWINNKDREKIGVDEGGEGCAKILLDDGSYITALRDPEGNGTGWLIQETPKESFHIMPDTERKDGE